MIKNLYYRFIVIYYRILHNALAFIAINKLKFKYWFFRWNADEDNDIVFSIMNIVHFVKYKQSTLVKFGRKKYRVADKRISATSDCI